MEAWALATAGRAMPCPGRERAPLAASDPARARENCRLAALDRWARSADRTAATQAARDALRASWDPGPDSLSRSAQAMIRAAEEAHMIRMRRARADRRKAAGDAT